MRESIGTAFAAALLLGLAGCGGGVGGGGGGPLLPIAVAPAPAPAPQPPAAAELKLTVEIAGAAATPDGSGKYGVLPGQQVTIKASDNVAWAGDAGVSVVTRTDVDTTVTQWVSRFTNSSKTQTGTYKLVANASEGRSKELNFIVQTGDYRNGDYTVFAANGSRHKLSIDFEKATYSMTDTAGNTTSGALTPPSSPTYDGDWKVQNSRITGTNVSSFWVVGDNILGGFPFEKPFSTPVSYAAAPLVATRAFVLTQSKLDGTYDRARISFSASGGESAIAQIQISGGGTVMKQCTNQIIYRIDSCPAGSVVTSAVEADAEPGMWQLKNPADGTLLGRFGVAMIDGDKTYLSAGTSPADGTQVLAIGVPAASEYVGFMTGMGWSTSGTMDMTIASLTQYQMVQTGDNSAVFNLAVNALGASSPVGIRSAESGGDFFFTMRSKRLDVLIGARSPSARAGFLHLGFIQ